MNKNRMYWTIAISTISIFLILSSFTFYSSVLAIEIFPPNSNLYGLAYSEWGIKYWQWLLAIPKDVNPDNDLTGAFCANGQTDSDSPIFFLTGGGNGTEKTCHVPQGKSLLVMVSAMEDSDAEAGIIRSDDELVRAATSDQDNLRALKLTLDGREYSKEELLKYRTSTGVFEVVFADPNIFDAKPGPSRAASDNTFVVTEPLKSGTYKVEFSGSLAKPDGEFAVWNVKYKIVVE